MRTLYDPTTPGRSEKSCITAFTLFSPNPAIVNTCLESMANFRPHYTLCPLVGPHNLVGVSSDKEHETVLVTLGPNIVVKHKVSVFSSNCRSPLTSKPSSIPTARRPKATQKLEHKTIKSSYMSLCLRCPP